MMGGEQDYVHLSNRLTGCAAATRLANRFRCAILCPLLCALLVAVFALESLIAQGAASVPRPDSAAQASFASLEKKANAARDADQVTEAIPLYRRALKLNPQWTEGWWSLGTLYYDGDSYAEAELAFEKVVALDPKHGTARAMLGLCEFELGQSDRALKDIEASRALGVLEDKQLRDVVMFHEGVLLQRAGQFEAAKAALSALCLSGAHSIQLLGAFGLVAMRMRDLSPRDPGTEDGRVVYHVGRAACLTGAKEYDAAKTEFEQVIAHAPQFPLVHYAYGCSLIDARDVDGAVREFEAEIAQQPKSVLPRMRIAVAEYKVDSAKGLKFAQEAVELRPDLPLGHYLLGLLLLDTGVYEKAVPELETARKAFPKEARIDLALATAYAHVGRQEDAAKAREEFARKKQTEQAAAQGALEITDAMDARPKE
jgi:tetratricopeptide (TPR) repeat protein